MKHFSLCEIFGTVWNCTKSTGTDRNVLWGKEKKNNTEKHFSICIMNRRKLGKAITVSSYLIHKKNLLSFITFVEMQYCTA